MFSLDTTRASEQNPGNFSMGFPSGERRSSQVAPNRERNWKGSTIPEEIERYSRGGNACSTCLDGLCNASIRSARLEATGCEQRIPAESSAAIAAPRFAMFHRRSAHACGCVPARWAAIVRRAARQADRVNRRERTSDPLVPATPGRAVPASIPFRPNQSQLSAKNFSVNLAGFSVSSVLSLLE
jgi:hypothetical protein